MGKRVERAVLDAVVDYYITHNESAEEVGSRFGVCAALVRRAVKDAGYKMDYNKSKYGKSSWNAGLSKTSDSRIAAYAKTKSISSIRDGYRKVWSDDRRKMVNEHHKVWFDHHGVWPDTTVGQQIHHIDGDKLNNTIENLVLLDIAAHSAVHKQYEGITCALIKSGHVRYNTETNSLEISDELKRLCDA